MYVDRSVGMCVGGVAGRVGRDIAKREFVKHETKEGNETAVSEDIPSKEC